MNTCRINHRIQPFGICSEIFYTNEFTNLSLAPNDSIWINLGLVHSSINFFTDTIDLDLCVFSSHPNQVTDTIVPNDQYCKYVYLGSVGMQDPELFNISIYPNPVQDELWIDYANSQPFSINIINEMGKIVVSAESSDNKTSVVISDLPGGIYFVRIISDDRVITRKIVKV